MDKLPLELVQRILTYLDLVSLRNAALSCRLFFEAFKDAEELIVGESLLHHISYDVLPEAILVDKSRSLGSASVTKRMEFKKKHLHDREPAPTKWKFTHALALIRFHRYVIHLSQSAARDALARQPRLCSAGQSSTPTSEEMHRFERALYRFQLYRNLVGEIFPISDDELGEIFFEWFSAWENEQLACIYEFLIRLIAKPFNYFVDHDVGWGYLRINYIDQYRTEEGQFILAEGLEKITRLSLASGYEQICAILSRRNGRYKEPYILPFFLDDALEKGANPFLLPFTTISEMTEYDRQAVLGVPFYADPDPGPASIFKWVNRDAFPGEIVAQSWNRVARTWAYPFWNLSRLEAGGLLEDPEIQGQWDNHWAGLEEYTDPDRLSRLEDTRMERMEISEKGGTGFYSSSDTSSVKWPVPEYDHPRNVQLKNPQSLEEAKSFLATLAEKPLTT